VRVASGDITPLLELKRKGAIFVAHNAAFEAGMFNHVGIEGAEFICTMALAQSHGLPASLENAAKSLQLGYTKDPNGMRLINKFCKPNKHGEWNVMDKQDMKEFLDYCEGDVVMEKAIFNRLPKLSDYEQRVFNLTRTINERGIKIDLDLAKKASALATSLTADANERLKELTDDKFYSLGQTVRLKNYLNEEYGLDLESVASQELTEVLPFVKDAECQEIILLRLNFGKSSAAKFDKACMAVNADGRVRQYLIYHGAGTGRWTSMTIQVQNLPRGIGIDPDTCIEIIRQESPELFNLLYEDPIGAISTCIRGLFVAEKGKMLYVVDYSAIEARVVAWLAGEKKVLKLFAEGADVYVEMAKEIFRNPHLTPKDKQERFLGKTTVLGCGFGMGPDKFFATCSSYGLEVTPELAEKAVKTYRKTNKQIVSFWYDLERAAVATLRTGKTHRCGPVRFIRAREFLYCELPSKRRLAYYKPSIANGELTYFTQNSQTHTFMKTHTYGGKLCENITQAVARDIMADAMLRLEEAGLPIVLSVHDEVVVETLYKDADFNKTALAVMIDIMTTLPQWAKGCPIAAEGFETERYRK
jgi:DNA polymerase